MPTITDTNSSTSNRLLDAVLLHTKQEVAYRASNPAARRDDTLALELRRNHYQSVLEAYRKVPQLTAAERATLRYIRHAVRRDSLRRRPLVYRLGYRAVSWLVNTAIGRRANITSHRRDLEGHEKAAVVAQNMVMLGDNLRSAGFGLVPEQAIKEHLRHQIPQFDLLYNDPNYTKTDFVLHFKRLPGADAYYFAGFDAIARPTLQDVIKRAVGPPRLSFSMAEGPAFTAQQAANMVAGRPVQKEVGGQLQWFRPDESPVLNLPRADFDLVGALDEIKIKEMTKPVPRHNLLAALASGEQRPVTLVLLDGREEKVLISVTPDVRGVQLHSMDGRYLDLNDYINRLLQAGQAHHQAQVRQLEPYTPKSKATLKLF